MLKDARMKRKSSKSKEWLDKLINNPELFVGKIIMHKVQEDEEDIPELYDAAVVRIEKIRKTGYKQCLKSHITMMVQMLSFHLLL